MKTHKTYLVHHRKYKFTETGETEIHISISTIENLNFKRKLKNIIKTQPRNIRY